MDAIAAALHAAQTKAPKIECRLNEQMQGHTSFKIGGRVRAMFLPCCENELIFLHELMSEHGIQPLIIGNGTNLLVAEGELSLIVIKMSGIAHLEAQGDTGITAGCGVPLARLAMFARERGLAGLEFAHGIPGTVGGGVLMNAGAYGGEMRDVVVKTSALGSRGVYSVAGDEHGFSYRHSRFMDGGDTVLSSTFSLTRGEPESIGEKMAALAKRRRDSQPLDYPSAGSAFKRPESGYAAAMIEQAGLKGFTIGAAQVSEKHAGFIINRGGATFADVLAVFDHVRETVLRRTGTELIPEVKIING